MKATPSPMTWKAFYGAEPGWVAGGQDSGHPLPSFLAKSHRESPSCPPREGGGSACLLLGVPSSPASHLEQGGQQDAEPDLEGPHLAHHREGFLHLHAEPRGWSSGRSSSPSSEGKRIPLTSTTAQPERPTREAPPTPRAALRMSDKAAEAALETLSFHGWLAGWLGGQHPRPLMRGPSHAHGDLHSIPKTDRAQETRHVYSGVRPIQVNRVYCYYYY